jgi:hypothetical protein
MKIGDTVRVTKDIEGEYALAGATGTVSKIEDGRFVSVDFTTGEFLVVCNQVKDWWIEWDSLEVVESIFTKSE